MAGLVEVSEDLAGATVDGRGGYMRARVLSSKLNVGEVVSFSFPNSPMWVEVERVRSRGNGHCFRVSGFRPLETVVVPIREDLVDVEGLYGLRHALIAAAGDAVEVGRFAA